jgi:malate/lactate dehydrogenase
LDYLNVIFQSLFIYLLLTVVKKERFIYKMAFLFINKGVETMGVYDFSVGIFGATGNAGKAVLQELLTQQYVKKVFLEVKAHNRCQIPDLLSKDRIGKRENIDRVFPIDVSTQGYSMFSECEVILLCAGASIPKTWIEDTGRTKQGLKDLVSKDALRKKDEIAGKIREVKRSPILSEKSDIYTRIFDAMCEDDADGIIQEYSRDLEEAWEIFSLMNEIEQTKKNGIEIGYRAKEFFPRNVPIMRNYARILKGINYQNLVMVLSNVTDFCCSVLCSENPELTENTLGLNHLDTLRMTDDLVPALFKDLPSKLRPRIYVGGNHDAHMILMPELSRLEINGQTTPAELREMLEKLDKFKQDMENVKGPRSIDKLEELITRYAPAEKKTRDIVHDAKKATGIVVEGVFKSHNPESREIFTNSIFQKTNEEGYGIFVTLPHVMNFTKIEPHSFNPEPRTADKLERCRASHEALHRELVKGGFASGFPIVPAKRCEPEKEITVEYRDRPRIPFYLVDKISSCISIQDLEEKTKLPDVPFDGKFNSVELRNGAISILSRDSTKEREIYLIAQQNLADPGKAKLYRLEGDYGEFFSLDQMVVLSNRICALKQYQRGSDSGLFVWTEERHAKPRFVKIGPDISGISGADNSLVVASGEGTVFVIDTKNYKIVRNTAVRQELSNLQSCAGLVFASAKEENLESICVIEPGKGTVATIDGAGNPFSVYDEGELIRIASKTSYGNLKVNWYDKKEFPERRSVKKSGEICCKNPDGIKNIISSRNFLMFMGSGLDFLDLGAMNDNLVPAEYHSILLPGSLVFPK